MSPHEAAAVSDPKDAERDAPTAITLHGRSLNYVQAGRGPVLLLIHGMAGNLENWQAVIEPLAQRHTVVAP